MTIRIVARLAAAVAALAAVAGLLAHTAPTGWPHAAVEAAAPPEVRIPALATAAAYGCLAWLALVLLAVASGSGLRVAPVAIRRVAERALGVALVTSAAGVLAAGPALADGRTPPPWGEDGPFDRPVATTPAPARGPTVVVADGDTLWDIASRTLGPRASPARVATEWPRWYAANRAVIGPDPSRIRPGQRLAPPRRSR